MPAERRTILYSGMVQGVGFRWTAMNALRDLPVTGYVRNLPDGRVELVVEGVPEAAQEAQERVRRVLGRYIRDERHQVGAATGEFPDFGIRR